MAPVEITTEIFSDKPPRGLLTEWRKAMKEGFAEAIAVWHADYLPGHFYRSAINKYGYQARSTRYERRKQHLFGHRHPLVYTGALKRSATTSIRITSTSRGGTGTFRGTARALNFSGRSNYPNLREELTATTQEQREQLAWVIENIVARRMNKAKAAMVQRKIERAAAAAERRRARRAANAKAKGPRKRRRKSNSKSKSSTK